MASRSRSPSPPSQRDVADRQCVISGRHRPCPVRPRLHGLVHRIVAGRVDRGPMNLLADVLPPGVNVPNRRCDVRSRRRFQAARRQSRPRFQHVCARLVSSCPARAQRSPARLADSLPPSGVQSPAFLPVPPRPQPRSGKVAVDARQV
jgi:hypothetical protein